MERFYYPSDLPLLHFSSVSCCARFSLLSPSQRVSCCLAAIETESNWNVLKQNRIRIKPPQKNHVYTGWIVLRLAFRSTASGPEAKSSRSARSCSQSSTQPDGTEGLFFIYLFWLFFYFSLIYLYRVINLSVVCRLLSWCQWLNSPCSWQYLLLREWLTLRKFPTAQIPWIPPKQKTKKADHLWQ